MIKLNLEIDGEKSSFESNSEDNTFDEILQGFIGCMFAQGFIPGTEMRCFAKYMNGMAPLYAKNYKKED